MLGLLASTKMEFSRLDDPKVAITTGAGRDSGAASARALAGRDWKVAGYRCRTTLKSLADELGGIGITGSFMELADLYTVDSHDPFSWSRRAHWILGDRG